MKELNKNEWKKIQSDGFKPRNSVYKTSHGRYYYMVETDYDNYLKFMANKNRKLED